MMVSVGSGEPTYWERVSETRWGRYITRRELSVLHRALDRSAPGVALEVGCEGGRWSAVMHDRGWRVICTDVDAVSLARCQARIPEARCIHVSASDETLPAADAEVLLVLAYEVPVTETRWFVAEAARVLSPGGILICSYMNPFSLRGVAYRLLSLFRPRAGHGVPRFRDLYRWPTYRAFRNTLRAHGFMVSSEEGICWFPFTRDSNSRLVPVAVTAEAALGLRRLASLSPWVLCVALLEGAQRAP